VKGVFKCPTIARQNRPNAVYVWRRQRIIRQGKLVFSLMALNREHSMLEHQAFWLRLQSAFLQSIRCIVEKLAGGFNRTIEDARNVALGKRYMAVQALPQSRHQLIECVILGCTGTGDGKATRNQA